MQSGYCIMTLDCQQYLIFCNHSGVIIKDNGMSYTVIIKDNFASIITCINAIEEISVLWSFIIPCVFWEAKFEKARKATFGCHRLSWSWADVKISIVLVLYIGASFFICSENTAMSVLLTRQRQSESDDTESYISRTNRHSEMYA